jgi:NADPH:quinone reductase
MKAVVFEQHGDPRQVLQVRDIPQAEPGPGQVRVRMLCSPINPSDLLVVRGRYGTLPNLPATPGFEGVGIVEASGGGLYGKLMVGKRVAVLNRRAGNWREQVIVPANEAFPFIPKSLPDEQVATLFVNPATAWIMTTDVLRVPRQAFLLQTAAGSTLGKMVIRLGKHLGFHTINVVRRQDTADQLKKLGAEHIINTSTEDLTERVADITQGKGILHAIDAVGGDTGSKVLDCLGVRGRMVVYGALEDKPIPVSSRALIMGSRIVEGFWLADWVRQRSPLKMLFLLRKVGKLIAKGILTSDIAESFPLEKVVDAVQAAETPGRQGKVLLKMSDSRSIMSLKV